MVAASSPLVHRETLVWNIGLPNQQRKAGFQIRFGKQRLWLPALGVATRH